MCLPVDAVLLCHVLLGFALLEISWVVDDFIVTCTLLTEFRETTGKAKTEGAARSDEELVVNVLLNSRNHQEATRNSVKQGRVRSTVFADLCHTQEELSQRNLVRS